MDKPLNCDGRGVVETGKHDFVVIYSDKETGEECHREYYKCEHEAESDAKTYLYGFNFQIKPVPVKGDK